MDRLADGTAEMRQTAGRAPLDGTSGEARLAGGGINRTALAPAPGEASRSSTRILVVDDEIEIAESLADFLIRKEGFQVHIAHDGQQAIAYLENTVGGSNEVDLVLLDMRMPGLSGLDVLDWIRKHPDLRYTRVVLLTAAASSDEKVQALSAGAGLLGRSVHYGAASADIGVVDQVKPDNGSILVRIGDQFVPIANIVSVEEKSASGYL